MAENTTRTVTRSHLVIRNFRMPLLEPLSPTSVEKESQSQFHSKKYAPPCESSGQIAASWRAVMRLLETARKRGGGRAMNARPGEDLGRIGAWGTGCRSSGPEQQRGAAGLAGIGGGEERLHEVRGKPRLVVFDEHRAGQAVHPHGPKPFGPGKLVQASGLG